ncbi:MAG TPA: GYD domain-containing protein [Burkholderiales bacterium]|nr:GYD domain-containing protein [Burkholderiales bacterium]
MAAYLIQFSFTQKGMEKIKESPARVEAAKKIVRNFGGEVKSFYAILGSEFDTMFIVEAPNDQKVGEMVLAVAMLGNVRTRTVRLFSEDEFKSIIASLP